MTKYATIRVTAYCSAQGPIVTDHGDGTVTINVCGKLVTGRRIQHQAQRAVAVFEGHTPAVRAGFSFCPCDLTD